MRTFPRTIQIGPTVCLATVALLLLPGCGSHFQTIQPFASSCKTDDEIPAKDLAAVQQFAIDFVQNALGPNLQAAYSVFTADAKANVSSEKFAAMFKQGIQPMGPFKDLHVAHTYIAKVTGSSQEQRVVCGNLSRAEGWVGLVVRAHERGGNRGFGTVSENDLGAK